MLVGCQSGIMCPHYVPTLETNCKQHKDISFSIISVELEQKRMLSCNEICSDSSPLIGHTEGWRAGNHADSLSC